MYATPVNGWVEVTIVVVDHASLAAGEEQAYTILMGVTERGTVRGRLCALDDYKYTFEHDSDGPELDSYMDTDEGLIGGGASEVRGVEGREGEGDAVITDDQDWWEGAYQSDESEVELRDGRSIFRREESPAGCGLTGQHKAGRGVVPWANQHDGGGDIDDHSASGLSELIRQEHTEELTALSGRLRFDRTRHMSSTPWRLAEARVRLVDCTDPKLRGIEGSVEGWEPENGRVRVRTDSGHVVRVWSCELAVLREQQGHGVGDGKRRTLDGHDSGGVRDVGEVKRARIVEVREQQGEERQQRVAPPTCPTSGNLINSVTSEKAFSRMREVGNKGILTGIANGLKTKLR
jgi:hypothetical protein